MAAAVILRRGATAAAGGGGFITRWTGVFASLSSDSGSDVTKGVLGEAWPRGADGLPEAPPDMPFAAEALASYRAGAYHSGLFCTSVEPKKMRILHSVYGAYVFCWSFWLFALQRALSLSLFMHVCVYWSASGVFLSLKKNVCRVI